MIIFFIIILIHWITDFIFQDEVWASGKSRKLTYLLKHTSVYSLMWFIFIGFYLFLNELPLINALYFSLITFICHTITDFFTSKRMKKQIIIEHYGSSIPNFGLFTTVGFDQLLHYIQLGLTWYFIIEIW